MEKETIPVDSTKHDWGVWETTKQPAVGVAGEQTRTCKNNSAHKETRPLGPLVDPIIDPTPCTHENTTPRIKKEATCIEEGLLEYVCDKCGEVTKTEKIPAKGHDWGDWEVTKPAAPGVAGEETRTCKNDPSHTETKPIDPLPVDDPACPHTNKSWKETKAATCTTEGEKQKICDACGQVLETKVIPALGHDDGEWVVIEKPTNTKDGLKQLQCTRCHEVLKEEVIDHITTEWRFNQSVCSRGIRFRDINPNLTNKWFMFTPIDLSKDGTQAIDLIAANITYAGKVTVEVNGDAVKVNYKLNHSMEKRDMAFTILPDLASVSSVELNDWPAYQFGPNRCYSLHFFILLISLITNL